MKGAVSLLIALGIFIMLRMKKKERATMGAQRQLKAPVESRRDQLRDPSTVQVTNNEGVDDNPFLTENEKAIIRRAVSFDGVDKSYVSSPLTKRLVQR
jgi:hypothetical protein